MEHGHDAGQRFSFPSVDSLHLRMWIRTAQRPREQHAIHAHVLAVVTQVGDYTQTVKARNPLSDHVETLTGGRRCRACCRWLSRARPRRRLAQLCGIQSDYGSRHLVEFSDQLVPHGIVREHPPLAFAQAGRVLRILDYAQRINLLLHILAPIYLSVGPTVLLTAAPYRACVRSRSRGSLRYTASRPHYYRPVPPRLLRPYRMARLGQNLAHSGFVESCRIPNRRDCTFRARYVENPRFLLQVERKIVELLNGAKRRDKLKLP